ncbi:MAG: ABC transporter permease, partial [Pirellulales bacterium]|nr:ABC transporter permease [Pirellulales bacterium]
MANWRGNALKFCNVAGLPILEPFVRLIAGEDPREQFKGITKFVLLPIVAIAVFLGGWSLAARTIVTDSMQLPSPTSTWKAGRELFAMHTAQKAQDAAKKQQKL